MITNISPLQESCKSTMANKRRTPPIHCFFLFFLFTSETLMINQRTKHLSSLIFNGHKVISTLLEIGLNNLIHYRIKPNIKHQHSKRWNDTIVCFRHETSRTNSKRRRVIEHVIDIIVVGFCSFSESTFDSWS